MNIFGKTEILNQSGTLRRRYSKTLQLKIEQELSPQSTFGKPVIDSTNLLISFMAIRFFGG
jgi:hypothetical protein